MGPSCPRTTSGFIDEDIEAQREGTAVELSLEPRTSVPSPACVFLSGLQDCVSGAFLSDLLRMDLGKFSNWPLASKALNSIRRKWEEEKG
jgi:hypothetical protein